ncbi:MAG: hypothetical protein ACI9SB_001683 [Candidatus Azotimanducaceae bacterium]|jgi:hypothetical protein
MPKCPLTCSPQPLRCPPAINLWRPIGLLLLACIAWGASAQDNLPFLKEQAAEYPAAIEGYQTLIDEIIVDQGNYSLALAEPLIGLSRSLLKTGDVDAAEQAARRAQHLYHRNDGVLAIGQVDAIKLLVQYYLQTGQPALADQQQQFAYYLATRQGYNSEDLLPAGYELADWYKETGQYRAARRTLERIIEQYAPQPRAAEDSSVHPALLAAYTRLATITRLDGVCCSYRKLDTAAQLFNTNEMLSSQQKMALNLALGDAHLLSNRNTEAMDYYRKAWLISEAEQLDAFDVPREIAQSGVLVRRDPSHQVWLPRTERSGFATNNSSHGAFSREFRQASVEERLSLASLPPQSFTLPLNNNNYQVSIRETYTDNKADRARSMIGAPFQFSYSQLMHILPNSLQKPEKLADLAIEMEFTVDADGNLRDISILNESLPRGLRTMMLKVLVKSKFRPRLENGVPMATQGVKLIQTFKSSV